MSQVQSEKSPEKVAQCWAIRMYRDMNKAGGSAIMQALHIANFFF